MQGLALLIVPCRRDLLPACLRSVIFDGFVKASGARRARWEVNYDNYCNCRRWDIRACRRDLLPACLRSVIFDGFVKASGARRARWEVNYDNYCN
ncbi:MAG: hypothetical protein V1753_12430, partial [Pseudomonadota bacterium]